MGKKLSWLEEVKLDAEYNYKRHLREQEDRRAFEDKKRTMVQPSEQPTPQPQEEKKGK